jgi:murein DD-endopeptidase MepM/ murein hydrolase activator NlpD
MSSDRSAGARALLGLVAAAGILAAAGVYAARDQWPGPKVVAVTPRIVRLLDERVDTLRYGESVSDVFFRQGYPGFALSQTSSLALFDPRRLRPGLVLSFQHRDSDSLPTEVSFRAGARQRVILRLTPEGWVAGTEPVQWWPAPVVLQGSITSSLYAALDSEGNDTLLSSEDRVRAAWDIADVFAWQVDFTRDIRPGDSFRVLIERETSEYGETRYGRVLAGDLVIGGSPYTAFRWTAPDSSTGFYDAEGRALRRAFLLAPVPFRRISSSFSSSRLHPILGLLRKHQGTDYAADLGTPVLAAGAGVVVRSEWSGGYGNLIEIRHPKGIVTRYGHLQAFANGIEPGVQVTQGDVIGYVGETGLATGPHLHYEFRVNGVARDPRGFDPGSGDPVALAQLREFERERSFLTALLNGGGTEFATNPDGRSVTGVSF